MTQALNMLQGKCNVLPSRSCSVQVCVSVEPPITDRIQRTLAVLRIENTIIAVIIPDSGQRSPKRFAVHFNLPLNSEHPEAAPLILYSCAALCSEGKR